MKKNENVLAKNGEKEGRIKSLARRLGQYVLRVVTGAEKPRADIPQFTEYEPGEGATKQWLDVMKSTETPDQPTFIKKFGKTDEPLFSLPIPEGEVVSLPTRAFVSAPDLESWNGRVGLKNGEVSEQLIKKYARQPAETAPPISRVVAYYQPNERIVYALVGNGAHRLAAAQERGDATIKVVDAISVHVLDHNILPRDDASDASIVSAAA